MEYSKGQQIIYRQGKTAFTVEYVQPAGNQKHLIRFFTPDGYKTMIVSAKSLQVKHADNH